MEGKSADKKPRQQAKNSAIAVAIGVGVGVALNNIAIGMAIGITIAFAFNAKKMRNSQQQDHS